MTSHPIQGKPTGEIRVLLINQANIPHFRIPVYGYLKKYLKNYGYDFMVTAAGIQPGNPHPVEFQYFEIPLSARSLTGLIRIQKIDVIISWVDMKHLYLFPVYFIAKMLGRKMIYWGQGGDLLDRKSKIKNLAYATEQALCDAIILYANHLKKYVPARFHNKVFIANNTLCVSYQGLKDKTKESVLKEFGIHTKKNIICVGRLQKRKRLEHLFEAHSQMKRADIGLILVGPDQDGVLNPYEGENIFKLGPVYGDKKFDLLSSADVYCLPGAVGLSIVDAFYCGLPLVTEGGDESAEIMYLKNGENGFVVPRGEIPELRKKLLLLLDDTELRSKFSSAAKREISENGSIEKMCKGFRDALVHTTNNA
ncbi:MAG: glycosyltransferase family 4 protein [Proteobacteria bacterium]|nr:glycosyltransferase family 4 protein [Pseudomonadota bacterium]MBU1711082.1 glycosyltransferase family 4 protein [Pseudomonadota bacterium]